MKGTSANSMKSFSIVIASLLLNISGMAQNFRLEVWPGGAPDSNGMTLPEKTSEGHRLSNVSKAEIFVYLPEKDINTGAAVVICPGGGYSKLSMGSEGFQVAEWLASRGIAGIVLKYRLPYGHHEIPLGDAQRTLRLVRHHAEKWGINPAKIGIAGASAGGHLASTAATRFDSGKPDSADPVERFSCRPDFMLLLYPVISFINDELGGVGSRNNLIGVGKRAELMERYSNERHVTAQTPPTFLVLADDDAGLSSRHSIEFYLALKKFKIPAEMHIFRDGGHGFGMNRRDLPVDQWPDLFVQWMEAQGITQNHK